MFTFLLKRLAQIPLVLGAVLLISMVLIWVAPGDPTVADNARKPSEEVIQAIKAQYHMDQGLGHFLWNYLKNVLLHGDFGPSIKQENLQVSEVLSAGLPVSMGLGMIALSFAVLLGTAAGLLGALRPRSAADGGALALTVWGVSLPSFVTGALLMAGGALLTRFGFPLGGWSGPACVIMPAFALSLAPAAYVARLVRLGLADVMHSDYIRTARAKGLSYDQALMRHGLKVAYLPVLSFLGPAAAATMTGSFVVEKVFNIPGLGQDFVASVQNKDPFMILGVVLVYSTLLVVFNLLVDIAYVWVDPRIDVSK